MTAEGPGIGGRGPELPGDGAPQRQATLEDPYIYTMSGLKHVGLVGIQVRQCPRCKDESPIIPRIGELHRVIAQNR